MSSTIEVTDLIVNINSYFSNIDTRSKNLGNINTWFLENGLDRYYDDSRNKITATYIAHILKIHKKFIFDRDIVQNCLNKWLKKDAAKILDFFRSEEDTIELYEEFIKYKDKYYTGQLSSQAIRTLNSKMNEALSYLEVTSIDKNLLITQQEILPIIKEKRLDTIKEYLKDIGKSTRINTHITRDKVKDLFKDSVLAEHIQSYIEVTSQNNLETNDEADSDFDENKPNYFDRTDETYKSFLKDIKSLQSRYDNQNKQDARVIDKALWVLTSTDKQRDKVFEELKGYRTDKLKINLSVTEENNKFKIQVSKLERIANGKENNHIVPVSVFLKSLKYSLDNQEFNNIKEIFSKLCYFYGRDYEKNIVFQFLRDKIVSLNSISDLNIRLLLEDSIIPFIYFHWNERAEATYELAKTHKSFGEEGNKIRVFNEKLENLYDNVSNKSFRQSFRQFKSKIAQDYFKVLDIQGNNIDNERFNVIVGDAIEVLRIWLQLLEQSGNEILSRHTQQDEYKTWKKDYLTKKEFGTKLIEAQKLGKVQEDKWKKNWEEYVLQHPDISVDERSSEGVSSLDNVIIGLDQRLLSPGRSDSDSSIDTEQEELYNKENIKKILSNGINDNLVDVDIVEYDDDLDEAQRTQRVEQLKQEQQTRLINQLKRDLLASQSSQITKKFYVLGVKSDTQKIISASIIKFSLENHISIIKIFPLLNYQYSQQLLSKINLDPLSDNVDVNICSKMQCGVFLIKAQELEISKCVEIARLRIQHIDSQVSAIQGEVNSILEMSIQSLEAQHKIVIEGSSNDKNVESRQDGNGVSVGEQAGTSGVLKRKLTGSDSPVKKVKFNLENLEEQGDNIDLQASGSSCSTHSSSKKRLKRDICQEDDTEEIFPYEPLEENVAEPSKIDARLYSQIAYLVALEQLEPTNPNIKPDDVLTYLTNIGDIISEGKINHSLREQELLQTHYGAAQDFFNKYSKDQLLDLVGVEIDSSSRAWIFDNGKHSLLVSYDSNHYQLYSPDLNYRQSFQTKEGVSFTDIELYAEAFFKWCSNSIEYELFALKSNVPEEITNKIKQAKFWHPDQVVSDLVLLDKGSFSNIDEIPAKVVRELFFLDSKVPELTALHENFFAEYSGRVAIRVEELHHVLSLLTPQASESLVNLVKQYNFPVDTAYLDNMSESTKSLLHSYHNEISNKLKTSQSITIQDLSDLSWQVLAQEMTKNPEISSELRELSLQSMKELHSVAATRAHALGITSQTLFFLPDIIRSMNTGNFEGLQKTSEMMLGDMAFNKMYGSLISKLETVLPESRIALLKKLPITSPIFKILTIHSIIELHKQLNNLPADSEEAGIIKHQLGEQYFTIGLMVAELFGLELGPLWIGLMAEQLVYGAIALRKQYHLDIPFGEAFLMNLGFEQDKLQSILTERQLVDLNLSLVNRLSAQTNTSYGLVIVKVPKMSYDEAHLGNTVIEFKPKDSHFCMEDNVFLENSSGYKRISSVISNEQNNNCVETASLQIFGNSLTALYANNNSTEKQSIYVNFDPNEGDMKLHFTKEGLNRLDKLNNHQQSNANVTSSYVVTAQIYHKPYPDQIGLFGNKDHSFILNDDSKRVASNYYIDGTSSFGLEDNSISTSIKFLKRKLFEGYNAYVSGSTSNMQIKSIYSEDNIVTGHIILRNKDYLKLNLEHLLINGKLTIDIPHIEVLYAKGVMRLQHNHFHNNIIEVSPNVLTFKILLEAPSISRIDIKNKNASDVIIDMQHLNNRAFTLAMQAIHTEYKSYYTFAVEDLQPVLDEMTFTDRDFPAFFVFLCGSRGSVRGWCKINNDPIKNIISIKGKIDEKDGILTIEDKKSVLEIVKNTNETTQDNKHIEVVNYNNVVTLEDDLRFNQVLEHTNYNSSIYYNYLNKHNFTNWNIIEFNSSTNWTTLYHFKVSNIQINDINYFIKENKIYAILKDNIDGSKLLKDNKGKPVAIFINTTLSDSQISLKENDLEINNFTVHNLSDNIIFVFQKSNGEIFPLSLRLLKDSFKYANGNQNKEHFISLIENQIKYVYIEGIISIASSINLEKIQIDSIAYDKIIEPNPHNITNNFIWIKKYALTSTHEITLSDQSNAKQINITVNINCNTVSENCATTSQYEFNCLNNSILIGDAANFSNIVLHQHNHIGSTSPQRFHIQCNDDIVSKISLQDKQNLVLHNPLIYDQLTVDAKNVTILDAISINDKGSFITVGDNTKYFKITLKGRIHITKYHGTDYGESTIIRTIPREIGNDMQLIYEYTEKNNTRIYTVTLEHINERFFQDIQIEDMQASAQLIHFETPKTKYDWYNRDNDIKSVLKIKVKLPDSNKIGTLLINGTTYILNVYNQDEELVLREIKYQNLQNYSPHTEDLVFKNKLLNCIESYFCYYNFSPLSHVEQKQYLNLTDILVFGSLHNNHKVLLHLNPADTDKVLLHHIIPQLKRTIREVSEGGHDNIQTSIITERELKNTGNVEHKNVKQESSNGLWNFGSKLSNLVNFHLLPGAEGATSDKSKSFNDIYKLIKQSNNHPSDTQIKKQHHKAESENNDNYNQYYNNIENNQSSLSGYLIDDSGNDLGNLQTVINSIDIPSNLSLLTLLIGQFFGTNKALSSNSYVSPEQERNRYINELDKTVKNAISEMETKYGEKQITHEELEDILPSLNLLFNGQEDLSYDDYSTSILGKITKLCNHVYDFFGYEAN